MKFPAYNFKSMLRSYAFRHHALTPYLNAYSYPNRSHFSGIRSKTTHLTLAAAFLLRELFFQHAARFGSAHWLAKMEALNVLAAEL